MMALELLFASDIGLLSLFTIGFVIAMGAWIARYVARHVKQEEQQKGMGG